MELFVHKFNVNLVLLKLFAERNNSHHVPAENAVTLLIVEVAIRVEGILRLNVQNLISFAHWDILAGNSWPFNNNGGFSLASFNWSSQ
jgi:hypothetical protein